MTMAYRTANRAAPARVLSVASGARCARLRPVVDLPNQVRALGIRVGIGKPSRRSRVASGCRRGHVSASRRKRCCWKKSHATRVAMSGEAGRPSCISGPTHAGKTDMGRGGAISGPTQKPVRPTGQRRPRKTTMRCGGCEWRDDAGGCAGRSRRRSRGRSKRAKVKLAGKTPGPKGERADPSTARPVWIMPQGAGANYAPKWSSISRMMV